MVGRRTRAYGLLIEKPANHAKLITSLIVYFIHQCKIYENVSAAKQSPQFSCKYKSAGLLVLRKKIHFHKSQKNCIRTKRYFLPPYEKMKEKCFLSFLNGKVKMFAFPQQSWTIHILMQHSSFYSHWLCFFVPFTACLQWNALREGRAGKVQTAWLPPITVKAFALPLGDGWWGEGRGERRLRLAHCPPSLWNCCKDS